MSATGHSRDHGGRIDDAIRAFGGTRDDWIDLSTGINPVPYPVTVLPHRAWTALPDRDAEEALVRAARRLWQVPPEAAVLAVPGASSAIALIPRLRPAATVRIPGPTYNEHAAAFRAAGWQVTEEDTTAGAAVLVHPNNPDGRWYTTDAADAALRIIDESFCDTAPDRSLIATAARPGTLVLKSFGKFWGLAGLRLGFVIGDPDLVGLLAAMLGPWPVSGPALGLGAHALADTAWAADTRARLAEDTARLDRRVTATGATLTGGTLLFRLYDHPRAADLHRHLATHHILTRPFPWSATALRFGLPAPADWPRVETALGAFR
jgi:cobalamin biosynthetic protein CobC